MNTANQYFFSVEKLELLIHEYRDKKYPAEKGKEKTLKGFVFIEGADEKGNAAMFGFPLFSVNKRPGGDGDVLEQNTATRKAGCPYPPPCRTFDDESSCYSK